jgi:predicted amidohydrolase
MDKLRVAAVQIEHRGGDKAYNLGRVEYFTRKAAAEGAAVVSFPECCVTSYMYFEKLDYDSLCALAESVPDGEAVKFMRKLAASEKITVMAGMLELDRTEGGRLYNTYVSVAPDGSVMRYRKLHSFESKHINSGSEYLDWQVDGWHAGCLICYDCNLFENWRVLELRGVQVMFCPHQTGGFDIPCAGMGVIPTGLWNNRKRDPEPIRREFLGPKGREWLLKWLPSRAYDTGAYVVFSNGVGIDGDEVRVGGAMIINPHGIVLTETFALGDDMVVADLDPQELELNLGRSHTRARRPGLYGPLVEGAEEEGGTREIRNQIRKQLGVDLGGN